ncbi:MAG: tetratricopeptide repeat protein, partial [Candidatus Eremiobacterota bacterium]
MAFLRKRGKQFHLVVSIRDLRGRIRRKRLYTFDDRQTLRDALEPDRWARLQVELEQRYPDIALNWDSLREEALGQVAEELPSLEDQLKELRRAARTILTGLRRMRPGHPDDIRLLHYFGADLSDLLFEGAAAWDNLFPGPEREQQMELYAMLFRPNAEEADDLVEKARNAFARGRHKRCEELFAEARGVNPLDPDVMNSEGLCWLEAGDLERAEQLFREARDLAFHQLPPERRTMRWSEHTVRPYLRATFNLALLEERRGNLWGAIDLWKECLRVCPEDGVQARFHLGPTYQRLGELERAIECYREHCFGNLVDLPDTFYNLASALIDAEQHEEALEPLLQGLEINFHIAELLLKPP